MNETPEQPTPLPEDPEVTAAFAEMEKAAKFEKGGGHKVSWKQAGLAIIIVAVVPFIILWAFGYMGV